MFDRPMGGRMMGGGMPMEIPNGFLPGPRPSVPYGNDMVSGQMGQSGMQHGANSPGFMPKGRPRGRGPTKAQGNLPPWLMQMFGMNDPAVSSPAGPMSPGGMPPPPTGSASIMPLPYQPAGGMTSMNGGGYQALPQPGMQPQMPFSLPMLMQGMRGGGMHGVG